MIFTQTSLPQVAGRAQFVDEPFGWDHNKKKLSEREVGWNRIVIRCTKDKKSKWENAVSSKERFVFFTIAVIVFVGMNK